MKRIRKVFLMAIFLTLCAYVNVFSRQSENLYVNDFANVLNDETKNYITAQGRTLAEKSKAQVVVLTVKNLEGKTIEDYAINVFREWGIGDKDKNNGVLLLLSIEDRKVKIEVGYGLEGAINDGKAGRILDQYGVPYFKNSDWNMGVYKVYSSLIEEVYKEYSLEVPKEIENVTKSDPDKSDKEYIMLSAIILCVLLIIIFSKKGGGTPFIGGGGPFVSGGFIGKNSSGGFGGGSSGGGGASRGF